MKRPTEDFAGREFDWLACDGDDHVALLSMAGAGFAPPAVLRDTGDHDAGIDALLATPATTCERYAPELPDHLTNTWQLAAERGLFAFDCDPNGGPYVLAAVPEVPVRLVDLPPLARDVAGRLRLGHLRFDGLLVVSDEMIKGRPAADELEREISALWRAGKARQAGRLIFESQPRDARPAWALRLLRAVVEHTGASSPAIEAIVKVASEPGAWSKAHDVFDLARREGLRLQDLPQRSAAQDLKRTQLSIAEAVAAVTYNATQPDDPFDHDWGWSMAPMLVTLFEHLRDPELAERMWSLLRQLPAR